jgi:hypothetical protein
MSTVNGNYYGGIVKDGLVLLLDAAKRDSYPRVGTTWTDITWNGNNGTLTNFGSQTIWNSNNGGSIIFDGTNDYLINTSLPTFNVGSINIWFKPTTTINASSPVSTLIQLRYGASIGSGWYIQFGPATSLLTNEYLTIIDLVSGRRQGLTTVGGSFLANTWYNLVFNYESTQYQIYVNSVLNTSTSSPSGVGLLTNPNRLLIGAGSGEGIVNPFDFLNGNVSIVQIYNRTLSTSEITQNYNSLKGRFGL